jgi:hypothetical protein
MSFPENGFGKFTIPWVRLYILKSFVDYNVPLLLAPFCTVVMRSRFLIFAGDYVPRSTARAFVIDRFTAQANVVFHVSSTKIKIVIIITSGWVAAQARNNSGEVII